MITHRGVLAAMSLLLFFQPAPLGNACEGTLRPNCGRSIWLAKSIDYTIPHPGDLNDIIVPIRLYPYATWNTNVACAQPANAILGVEVECSPDDGGDKVTLGPFLVPVAAPTTPGVQPLLTGMGMAPELGGPFEVTIPAGTLPAGPNYECSVRAEYAVVFGAGIGAGTIYAGGDTKVCIVDPSPLDGAVPALEMRRIFPSGEALQRCRRGDQGIVHYLLANNHPTLGVSLDFSQTTNQVARTPEGADPDKTLFAISSPKKNTDNFPQQFLDLSDPSDLIAEGDPTKKDDQEISRAVYLTPGELRVISIAVRSHGMCLDGSCSELLARVDGRWEDGTEALACASGVFLVDDVAAKTPLVEVTDLVKADDFTDVQWSAAVFDKDKHRATLAAGNLTKKQGGPGTQTTGAGLVVTDPFPSQATDYLRMEWTPDRVSYTVQAFPQAENFSKMTNKVTIQNLSEGPASIVVPLFKKPNGANLTLTVDAAANTAVLKDKKKKVFDGDFSALKMSPPPGIFLESQTCRTFTITQPTGDYLRVTPPSATRLFDLMSMPDDASFTVSDPLTFEPLPWAASSDHLAVTLPTTMAMADEPLVAAFSVIDTSVAPDVSLTWISVLNGTALNSPYLFPIATRKQAGVMDPGPLDITDLTANINTVHGKKKDTFTLEGFVPVSKGFSPKGQPVVFQLLGQDLVFELDKKGKDKLGKTASLKVGKANDKGDVPFTLTLKKQDLSGAFAQIGADPDTLSEGVPVLKEIPVLGMFFGSQVVRADPLALLVRVNSHIDVVLD